MSPVVLMCALLQYMSWVYMTMFYIIECNGYYLNNCNYFPVICCYLLLFAVISLLQIYSTVMLRWLVDEGTAVRAEKGVLISETECHTPRGMKSAAGELKYLQLI